MYYKIIDIKTIQPNNTVYVLVHFWKNIGLFNANKAPDIINDFYISIDPQISVLIRDPNGFLITESGKIVHEKTPESPNDPFKRIVIDNDIPAFIDKCINSFIKRAQIKKYKGDLTDKDPKKEQDTLNIKSKIIMMKGKEKNVNI